MTIVTRIVMGKTKTQTKQGCEYEAGKNSDSTGHKKSIEREDGVVKQHVRPA